MHWEDKENSKSTDEAVPSMPEIPYADVSDVTYAPTQEEKEEAKPPCRHRVPVFADRSFYHYRDPRLLKEWESCERVLKQGGSGLSLSHF